jgi:hypothetical protein
MLLASIESGGKAHSGCGKPHPGSPIHSSNAESIDDDKPVDINPHPPFQGVFRSVMVSAGLLSGLLQLATELNQCALDDGASRADSGEGNAADDSRARTTCKQVKIHLCCCAHCTAQADKSVC